MHNITVRPMKEKDINQAADIHRKVIREGLGQTTTYNIEDLFSSSIKKSPNTCLVAEKDATVAGFIIGSIKEWGFGVERSGWIEMGIGKTLGEAIIQFFKDENIENVYTSVKWDGGDLIAFFKSIGFDKSNFINLELIEN